MKQNLSNIISHIIQIHTNLPQEKAPVHKFKKKKKKYSKNVLQKVLR